MTRSFFSLCITNAICLTSLWICISLGLFATKMQRDQDVLEIFAKMSDGKMEKDEITFIPYLSLTTISKSLIWLGFVMDTTVCFIEFMVVWLKVQAPPVAFYWLSASRYLSYIFSVIFYYLISENETGAMIVLQLVIWTLCRIAQTCYMCCMNKELSNEVDGINNPVVHAVGATGNKAMAGA